MKTSASMPAKLADAWSTEDQIALAALIGRAALSDDQWPQGAVDQAAREIGLEGGPNHWLVRYVMAVAFDQFDLPSQNGYFCSSNFLKLAQKADFDFLGPDLVALAKRRAGTLRNE